MPPPNMKGGKHYKKKAKTGEQDMSILQIDRQPDQQVARVIRVLGNRNMMCYCNDNKMRICHVRGKLRNRVYVEQGDIVLISLRDYEVTAAVPAPADKKPEVERGDILFKYPLEYLSKLKKEAGVNPNLFMSLETLDGARLAAVGGGSANVIVDGDDGFEFDRDGTAPEEGGGQDSDSDEGLNIDDI